MEQGEREPDRREPEQGSTFEEDAMGVPDHSTATPTQDALPVDQQMPPGEEPRGSDAWGTTAAEQREGEPLEDRLAQEEPETPAPDGDGVRLTDDGDPDEEGELASSGSPAGPSTASAEEAAVHERANAPGATDEPDSYVTDEGSDRA